MEARKLDIEKLELYLQAINSASTEVEIKNAVESYYGYLISEGHWYGNLALQAATNTGFSGRIANQYLLSFSSSASNKDIDITNMAKQLALSDITRRIDNVKADGTGYLKPDEIYQYHVIVFNLEEGLPDNAWTGTIFEEHFQTGSWLLGMGPESQNGGIPNLEQVENFLASINALGSDAREDYVAFMGAMLNDDVIRNVILDSFTSFDKASDAWQFAKIVGEFVYDIFAQDSSADLKNAAVQLGFAIQTTLARKSVDNFLDNFEKDPLYYTYLLKKPDSLLDSSTIAEDLPEMIGYLAAMDIYSEIYDDPGLDAATLFYEELDRKLPNLDPELVDKFLKPILDEIIFSINISGDLISAIKIIYDTTSNIIDSLKNKIDSLLSGLDNFVDSTHSFASDLLESFFNLFSDPDSIDLTDSGTAVAIIGGGGDDYIQSGDYDDIIKGGNGNDDLYTNAGDDQVFGGDGDDSVYGGSGDDYIEGNPGNDVLNGGEGVDLILGGSGNDELFGDSGLDTLLGGIGDDILNGGIGDDVLEGGTGADVIHGDSGSDALFGNEDNDILSGGQGNDVLQGNDGDDVLHGDDGNDNLNGGAGLDTLYGGQGNDTLIGDLEEDILEGGEGHDTYIINGTLPGGHATINDSGDNTIIFNGQTISLAQGQDGSWTTLDGRFTITKNSPLTITDTVTGGSITVNDAALTDLGINLVDASASGATVQGNADDEVLQGSGTADIITGAGGTDMLNGRGGNDTLYADGVIDPATFLANDTGGVSADRDWINAGDGDDIAIGNDGSNVLLGGLGDDLLLGGGNTDYLFGDGDAYPMEMGSTGHTTGEAGTEWEALDTPDGIELRYLNGAGVLHPDQGGNDALYAGSGDDYAWGGFGNDALYGGTGNDQLVGGEGHDVLMGEDGDDRLLGDDDNPLTFGLHGNDYIQAGAGNDEVAGQGGDDILYGEDGDDLLLGDDTAIDTAYHGNDQIYGGSGNDEIYGDAGDDRLYGGTGDDTINGDNGALAGETHGDDRLYGDEGNDTLIGGGGRDQLQGGVGNDTLAGDADDLAGEFHADDVLEGGEGDDILVGGGGRDSLSGGAGQDQLTGDSYYIDGQYHDDDVLDGGDDDDVVVGGGGNDSLYGGAGNDELQGDAATAYLDAQYHGDDRLDGQDGDDRLFGFGGNDTLIGGAGDDQLQGDATQGELAGEHHGSDLLDGGDGNDVLFGQGGGDTLIGGAGHDYLIGDGDTSQLAAEYHGDDKLYGGEGNDYLYGYGGNDVLYGGTDDDVLVGDDQDLDLTEHGDDLLDGGLGDDLLIAGGGDDILSGGEGADQLYGEQGNDTLDGGDGNDLVSGNEGDDNLAGGGGNDQIYGGTGHDTLAGGDGNDTLYAGSGDDTLEGGSGSDILLAGTGSDVLSGGEGEDLYVYNLGDGVDVIQDVGNNTLRFGGGISVDSISLALGSLQINVGDGGDAIHIEGFDPENPYANVAVNRFEFADGTILSYQQLLNLGFDLNGTGGDDTIYGTAVDDRISGFDGDDTIIARDGNDTLEGGGGSDTVYGDGGNDQIDGGAGSDTLYGGQGDDTYLAVDAEDTIVEYADEGTDSVQANFSYTLGNNLENLNLTGTADIDGTGNELANTISGNAGDNSLSGLDGNDRLLGEDGNDNLNGGAGEDFLDGGTGNDILDGGSGSDRLRGGSGDDTYLVDSQGDRILGEGDGEGVDTVISRSSYSLPNYIETSYYVGYGTPDQKWVTETSGEVENLTLTGAKAIYGYGNNIANTISGNELDNDLKGMAGDDVLIGNDGNDILDGGLGDDTMLGGKGDDSYVINQAGEDVIELENEGWDTVYSYISHQLDSNVEQAVLLGDGNNDAYGNELDNILIGNNGRNKLDGREGVDTLIGGGGNDIYYVDNSSDAIIEYYAEGRDIVNSYADNYTLSDNVENLTLKIGAISGTGNDLSNQIMGNASDNALYGMGGDDIIFANRGNDLIDGGSGDDIIVGDDGDDSIYGGEGNDDLYGNAGNDMVDGGAGDDWVNGGSGDNILYGRSGNDILVGGKFMYGGTGDDTYSVIANDHQVIENANEGHDHVISLVDSYTLEDTLEDLTVHGHDRTGIGNYKNNVITGSYGNQTLYGMAGDDVIDGGQDIDAMFGGEGDDQYFVDHSSDSIIENENEGTDSVYATRHYVLSDNVENLYFTENRILNGTGNSSNNIIVGTDSQNMLDGQGGNDNLDGKAGDDHLIGGDGNDVLFGGDDAIFIDYSYDGGEGGIGAAGFYDGGEGYYGSNPIFQIRSNNDHLEGNAGNDDLDGGSGDDTLLGGDGDDVLYGGDDLTMDEILELVNNFDYEQGYDGGEGYGTPVFDPGLIVFPSNDDYLDGGAGEDTLNGGSGNDVLDGGTGIDQMSGGTGNDIYYVDGYSEVITPPGGGNGGTDPGQGGEEPCDWCEDDYNLFSQIDIETPEKGNEGVGNGEDPPPPGHDSNWNDGPGTSPGNPGSKNGANAMGTADTTGSSDSSTETLVTSDSSTEATGDSETCNPSGGGGSGGGDTTAPEPVITYVTDEVIEAAGEGYDIVNASISYVMTDNVEELRLIGPEALSGTGNGLDNLIIGNEYDNVLDGGQGTDTLIGGLGNDTYVVDDPADNIVEQAGEGTDTVQAAIDYQLGDDLENLQLIGQEDIAGHGNNQNNQLTGNEGNNNLYGGLGNDTLSGGAGNDLLAGEAGDDTYIYAAGGGVDRIEDSLGINSLQFGEGISPDQVIARNTLVDGETVVQIRLLDQYGNELDQGIDMVLAPDGSIPVDSVTFADGTAVSSVSDMLITQETTTGTHKADEIVTDRNDDTIHAGRGDDLVNSAGGHDVIYGEKGRDTLFAAAGNDQVYGGDGEDSLYGSFGQDVLNGGDDDDKLYGGTGNDLLFGAGDEDELHGGSGNDLLIGGLGNDELEIGCGADVIAYNLGDGLDEVEFEEETGSATISLGGGINLEDITLERDGDDLIIGIEQELAGKNGGKNHGKKAEQGIVLDDWYDNEAGTVQPPYLTLQIVMEASADFDPDAADPLFSQAIQTFDLSSVIAQYDLAQAGADSGSQWEAMSALLDSHLESSDADALGGSLAYQYGLGNKLFEDENLAVSVNQLVDEQFGKDKQSLAG